MKRNISSAKTSIKSLNFSVMHLFFSQKIIHHFLYLSRLSYCRLNRLHLPLTRISLTMFVTACFLFEINGIITATQKITKEKSNITFMKCLLWILFTSLLNICRWHFVHICWSNFFTSFSAWLHFPTFPHSNIIGWFAFHRLSFQQLNSYVTSWEACRFDFSWTHGTYSFVLSAN